MDARTANQLRAAGLDPVKLPTGTKIDGKPIGEATDKPIDVEACPNGNVFITIPGLPPSKPRMTQSDKWKQRPEVMRYRAWCDGVRAAVGSCLPDPSHVAQVNWTAYFEPPRSWPKKRRLAAIGTLHQVKPDIDNIAKALCDCLFARDQNISEMHCRKRWDWWARLEVAILIET
jgi:Holliday junction resolvase RusA-like endonuclease